MRGKKHSAGEIKWSKEIFQEARDTAMSMTPEGKNSYVLGQIALALAKTGDIKRALSVTAKIKSSYIRENTFEDIVKIQEKKAEELWTEIPNKFEDIKLDAFVVMPNHVHGIIIICNYWEYVRRVVRDADAMNRVPTRKVEPEKGGGITGKNNPMLSENSLPKLIRWYKGRCSFEIRKMKNAKCFGWHSRYYDQVIKDRKELNKKRKYIWDNPWKWESDELNPRN